MDFREARIAMDILGRYECGQKRDWGNAENRKLPIDGSFSFEHDECWITLPRTVGDPNLTDEEARQLAGADWFFDDENGAWAHF